ncbi:restriction endonuclease [Actinokineospora sp. NBRC 105648]|uniref:restriction endonuclease n=1 Tax=Actinokineospora sp. NBRC 105648 TaxID=3032206 RepID=UPI0024A20AC4|nr:restriction endonuclease [Actinokineospora sp. NBRC 105648]GLZ43250.1 restriction endonuclease [Actinokineospora sp. NBRC 105648]
MAQRRSPGQAAKQAQQRLRWEEQQRKLAAREAEQQRKVEERQQREAELARQVELAAERTAAVDARVLELTGIVARALASQVGPLDFEALKVPTDLAVLDLGVDASPAPAPRWEQYAPSAPGAISRAFGGARRHEQQLAAAQQAYQRAGHEHGVAEAARQHRVEVARARHAAEVEIARQRVAAQHAEVDQFRAQVLDADRHAVTDYYQRIIDTVVVPDGFPAPRRAAYVPESTLLLIEWDVPDLSVVPVEKEYHFVKTRNAIEVRKTRPADEIRKTYQSVVAQLALQALHLAYAADPGGLVNTVVFNGMIDKIDPATGQQIRPCLITLRATRELFDGVVLSRVNPVDCVRKHFAAEVSDHPEALTPVEPFLDFDMADPRIVDPQDVISSLDRRPNLMDLSPKDFEHFTQNLFNRLGFDTKLFQASGDGGIDCIAYDPTPIRGGKYVIQVKQYTRTVPPSAVRDLFGVVHDQGATKGILITTSGFGPSSHEFANGKPLQLYDGTTLLGLCQQVGIDARIVMPPKTRNRRD